MIFWLIRYTKLVSNLLKSSIGCDSIDIEFKTLVLCIRNDYQITGNPHTESHCFHSQRDDFGRIWSIRECKLGYLILIIVCSQSLEISKSYHGLRAIETMILVRDWPRINFSSECDKKAGYSLTPKIHAWYIYGIPIYIWKKSDPARKIPYVFWEFIWKSENLKMWSLFVKFDV